MTSAGAQLIWVNLSRSRPRIGLVTMLWLTVFALPAAQGQVFSILHTFTGGSDGAFPSDAVTFGAPGLIYGSTDGGGTHGYGNVFKLKQARYGWTLSPLYQFTGGDDGGYPSPLTVGQDGSLYGATYQGGGAGCNGVGCGTVFRLRPPATVCRAAFCLWNETVLYAFTGGTDGSSPYGVIIDRAGNIYGTAVGGQDRCYGPCGLVYELTPANGGWTQTVLYNFTGGSDGGLPSEVVFDAAGNLVGTTGLGGDFSCNAPRGCGTVFRLTRSGAGWSEETIYAFEQNDGVGGAGGVVSDGSGNLYGAGFDSVFELSPSGGTWTLGVLYTFNCTDDDPCLLNNPLLIDASGNLYGTSTGGGSAPNQAGQGTVYKLTRSNGIWTAATLHIFGVGDDGAQPCCGLVFDNLGNLYGTDYWASFVYEITP